MNPSAIIPVNRTFASSVDYFYALTSLVFNDYIRARDSVLSEKDAREDLYDLFKFRSGVIDWIGHEQNHGPFCLVHGDLLPSNIIVDKDCNIKAVIDWMWSRTVPLQLFVSPGWISGDNIASACHGIKQLGLMTALRWFMRAMENHIEASGQYPPGAQNFPFLHPLVNLWSKT